jgi:starch synthase
MLLGMVSRLAEQKGLDILSKILDKLLIDFQIAILGFGDEKYHKILKKKADKNKKSFSLHLAFDEKLAHKIYASSDVFLMPSRFEPCGLSQMVSYKYATVPLVHSTGGLADTVIDYKDGGGGITFDNYNEKDLSLALQRAHDLFNNKQAWTGTIDKISGYDFSWEKSAKHYIKLYKRCQ